MGHREEYGKCYLPPLKGANVAEGRASHWAKDNSSVWLPVCMGLCRYRGNDLRDDCSTTTPVCQAALVPATVTSTNKDISICKHTQHPCKSKTKITNHYTHIPQGNCINKPQPASDWKPRGNNLTNKTDRHLNKAQIFKHEYKKKVVEESWETLLKFSELIHKKKKKNPY